MGKTADQRTWAFNLAVALLKPLSLALASRDWRGGENIPATGGCVVAVNHVSHIDPVTLSHYLYENGRLPHYLAKDSLFRIRVLGPTLRAAQQIPVERRSAGAAHAFQAAVQAIRDGWCVVFYPEGTITKDPEGWPMRGKTGAARVALETGCPVIPVGQWGAQRVLPAYTLKLRLFPRVTVRYRAGEPVDLDDLRGREITAEVLREATDRITRAVTAAVADLRGEPAPAVSYDPTREASA